MLDYIFFNENLLDRYLAFLEERGISFDKRRDEMGFVVSIPEDLENGLEDEADAFYEELLERQEEVMETEGDPLDKNVAAITVNLTDGRVVYAPVRPALLNKLLASISAQEVGELVHAIASAIENPDERPICKR